jgi:hypothetical protein
MQERQRGRRERAAWTKNGQQQLGEDRKKQGRQKVRKAKKTGEETGHQESNLRLHSNEERSCTSAPRRFAIDAFIKIGPGHQYNFKTCSAIFLSCGLIYATLQYTLTSCIGMWITWTWLYTPTTAKGFQVFLLVVLSALFRHSALCASECVSWHSRIQKYTMRQPAHFLAPTPSHPGFAQCALSSRC